MKKLMLISIVFVSFSCEKKYDCVITTPGLDNLYHYEFKGTHKEMKEFEQSGISGQTINCK